jgi:Mo-dependent nitrogenase C-terminus
MQQSSPRANNEQPMSQVFYAATVAPFQSPKRSFAFLQPVREWIDSIEIRDRNLAHRICKLIPAQCPFERDIKVLGHTIAHIPPMCKLNPLYDEFVGLRFRSLCYLADECGEFIS